ncbi:sensor histidine kinase [Cohnella panacarvi]|uniref:sensor histidine kinase n=1 Tax=Cohnella panacarvi TaxID=400776 RepID=UPI0004799FC9|nr:histidine kinase [Cohnella panacarvi]
MKYWQSVRFKIVFGFLLIIVPMVAFIIYNNLYAMNVVRNQVASNYNKLLSVNVRENDKVLLEFVYYLLRLKQSDPNIANIKNLRADDDEYTLSKIRLANNFLGSSAGMNNSIDTLFIYPRKEDEIFMYTQYSGDSSIKQKAMKDWMQQNLRQDDPLHFSAEWKSIKIEDIDYLQKVVDMGSEVYAGLLVRAESIMRGMESFEVGPEGSVFLINSAGEAINDKNFALLEDEQFRAQVSGMKDTYDVIRTAGKSYLVMSARSSYTDFSSVIVMPESYILRNLPFFQKILYLWIPLLVAILLSLYLFFLQRIMFKPLVDLIRGMRKIGQGRLEVRLPTDQSSEFAFMSGTFNQMAEQIERLKIDIYEEQLRVQRAEYKHLQIQINPHFYMNCLNIIYNLAALKDFKSVQKLSLYLADYFRFLMHSHRTVVKLEDEIGHVKNYLEIHKLRYLSKLDYDIDVDPRHLRIDISPLMIQPFVENSIIHGFNTRVQDGSVFRIRIFSEEDPIEPERFVRIVVTDNGSGFPQEMLRDLESNVYMTGTGEQHLGIWNILRRFKMLYEDEGGIAFRNSDLGGAVVEIRLPIGISAKIGVDGEAEKSKTSLGGGSYTYDVGS